MLGWILSRLAGKGYVPKPADWTEYDNVMTVVDQFADVVHIIPIDSSGHHRRGITITELGAETLESQLRTAQDMISDRREGDAETATLLDQEPSRELQLGSSDRT